MSNKFKTCFFTMKLLVTLDRLVDLYTQTFACVDTVSTLNLKAIYAVSVS